MPTATNPAAATRLRVHGFALRVAVGVLGLLTLLLFSSAIVSLIAQEPQRQPADLKSADTKPIDLKKIEPDLVVPAMKEAPPSPGLRVKQQLPVHRDSRIYHALYLPTNWSKDRTWPVLVEYPGNGPYANNLGDTNSGFVEDCNFAYGISGGQDFI